MSPDRHEEAGARQAACADGPEGVGCVLVAALGAAYGSIEAMTTPEGAWQETPDQWAQVPGDALERAITKTLEALEVGGTDPVGTRLAKYYDRAGNFAGATFVELPHSNPADITAADLHAVSLLSVNVGPGATRRILEPGQARSALLDKLSAIREVELRDAGADDFLAMAELYEEVKARLAEPTAAASDRWVTASKLCARKRPYLFPVRDSVVRDYLELTRYRNYQIDWQVFRAMLRETVILRASDRAVAAAHEAAGDRSLAVDRGRLRVLDAALWTYARKFARRA